MKKNKNTISLDHTCSKDATIPTCSTTPANRLRWTISQLLEILGIKRHN